MLVNELYACMAETDQRNNWQVKLVDDFLAICQIYHSSYVRSS